jgi:hypothetical protein
MGGGWGVDVVGNGCVTDERDPFVVFGVVDDPTFARGGV